MMQVMAFLVLSLILQLMPSLVDALLPLHAIPTTYNQNDRMVARPKPRTHPPTKATAAISTTTSLSAAMSQSDQERLLMSEPAMTAFILAELRHFLNQTMFDYDTPGMREYKWTVPPEELEHYSFDLQHNNSTYQQAIASMRGTNGSIAVDLLMNASHMALEDAKTDQPWSALGSAILYVRNYYRTTPELVAACERIGISDYTVAHHITDMYHHRSFRGTYTKTVQPAGVGEIAARHAVGLEQEPTTVSEHGKNIQDDTNLPDTRDDDDECLVWSPTTPGLCLHWKSDNEGESRKKRFERIQMEGTRDPRRGGSGTTR